MNIMKKYLLILPAFIFTLSACQTQNPYTGEMQYNNTSKGALWGALAGAAVGQATGQDTESTLIGAASGAALGSGIGVYMDRQAAELRAELQATGVQVQKSGNNITLVMPGNITFNTDSSDLNASFYRTLGSVAIILKKYNKTMIDVNGHTDSTGDNNYNAKLSQQRAMSVASYLQGQGIMPNRMNVTGFGENVPIASNSTAIGRAQNRRVELQIRPM